MLRAGATAVLGGRVGGRWAACSRAVVGATAGQRRWLPNGGFNFPPENEPKDPRMRPGVRGDPFGRKVDGKRKVVGNVYWKPPPESPVWISVAHMLDHLQQEDFLDLKMATRPPKFDDELLQQDPTYQVKKEQRESKARLKASARMMAQTGRLVRTGDEEEERSRRRRLQQKNRKEGRGLVRARTHKRLHHDAPQNLSLE